MLHIAVTGGIACGKSLAGKLFADHGAAVCDTDELAHRILRDDNRVSRAIVREFGEGILTDEGQIDRKALGEIVFTHDAARQKLDALVHPAVKRLCRRWLQDQASSGASMAVVLVPLLYEAGMARGWNAVVCIACRRATQLRRLQVRGFSRREAEQRIAAQMPLRQKMIRADYVIFNDTAKTVLEQQTTLVVQRILEK